MGLTVALRSWTVAHSQHRVIIETVMSERHTQSESPGIGPEGHHHKVTAVTMPHLPLKVLILSVGHHIRNVASE